MPFGERLKKLREENGLSREELAHKLGLSYWTISKYETGSRLPDHETTNKIANLFKVSIDYLYNRTEDRGPYEDSEARPEEIEKILRESNMMFDGTPLDEQDKEDVIEFIKVALTTIKKRKHEDK